MSKPGTYTVTINGVTTQTGQLQERPTGSQTVVHSASFKVPDVGSADVVSEREPPFETAAVVPWGPRRSRQASPLGGCSAARTTDSKRRGRGHSKRRAQGLKRQERER